MYWDKSYESWKQLGITGQPAGIVFDANGNARAKFNGAIKPEKVLEAIRNL